MLITQPVEPTQAVTAADPMLVSVDMGYGHLRAAATLADILDVSIERADLPPLVAGEGEQQLWDLVRTVHTGLSRLSHLPMGVGDAMRGTLDAITEIEELHERKDLTRPDAATRLLAGLIEMGLGKGLVDALRTRGTPLLTTYYSPALIADDVGVADVFCVVTDADVHRVWVAKQPQHSRVRYLAPSRRVVNRLRAYGVDRERIHLTGFPLPPQLLGGEALPAARLNMAHRLVRLDPRRAFLESHLDDIERLLGPLPVEPQGEPPRLTFAVGGAGAQTDLALHFLPSLAPMIRAGLLRVSLVAGTRLEVAAEFRESLARAQLVTHLGAEVDILVEEDFPTYYAAFNRLLADTDVLWTKPSELSFYTALGLPLIIAKPLGSHERYNRRWLMQYGAGLKQGRADLAAGWLGEWLQDGVLASAAWSGFTRLPKTGAYRIAELVRAAC